MNLWVLVAETETQSLALRFSIGQIQDVGLIFLAGMATFLNICLIRCRCAIGER